MHPMSASKFLYKPDGASMMRTYLEVLAFLYARGLADADTLAYFKQSYVREKS